MKLPRWTLAAHARLLAPSVLLLLGATAEAQSITLLGAGIAEGISADGTTVVGGWDGVWTWTAGTGQVQIGGSAAKGVSGDGSVVFGSDGTSPTTGAVWTNATGWQSIGGLPSATSGCPDLSNPYNISDGGDVATGLGWDGCSAFAFRWTSAGGFTQLPQLGSNSSRGNDVSGDGEYIGGWDEANNGTRRAAVWASDGTEQLILQNSPGNAIGAGEVWGFSSDGTWACGTGSSGQGAFRWSAATGVEALGNIPGFPGATGMAISDDGKTVVGFAGVAFSGITALIWTESGGMQRFKNYAANELGIAIPSAQDFQIIHDMTPDGRKVVGYVAQDAGPFSTKTPVLVDLPEPCGASTYGVGVSSVNSLSLTGGGGTSLGGTFLATTSGSLGVSTVTILSLGAGNFPFQGGFGLIDPGGLLSVFNELPVGGVSTNAVPIPSSPGLANLSVYFQSISDDAGQPFGWALSNGLELKICP